MTDLDRALDLVLAHEGGWSDHPADRGGRTMWGITEGTLATARATVAPPLDLPADIRELSQDQARQIYERLYWRVSGADRLPWPVSYAQLDAAVQHGAPTAARWLQRALGGLTVDGAVGPRTAARIAGVHDWRIPAARLLTLRGAYYIALLADPAQAVFARGWSRRYAEVARVVWSDPGMTA